MGENRRKDYIRQAQGPVKGQREMINREKISAFFICMTILLLSSCVEEGKRTSGRTQVPLFTDGGETEDPSVDEAPTTLRPTNDIIIDGDVCGCLAGKADTVGNCDSFCSQKSNQEATLYGTVTPGPLTASDATNLGNLYNWCTTEINDITPSCTLSVRSEEGGTEELNVRTFTGTNRFEVDIRGLDYNKVYIASILSKSTLSTGAPYEAATSEFQILRRQYDNNQNTLGPLRVNPISQYDCLIRSFSSANTVDKTATLHYYFPANSRPDPVPAGIKNIICHDNGTNQNEVTDSIDFDRINEIPGHFSLWSPTDPRFAKSDGQNYDINIDIKTEIFNRFGLEIEVPSLFTPLIWNKSPDFSNANGDTADAGESIQSELGLMMTSFVDSSTGLSTCPSEDDITKGDNPLFLSLRNYIGGGTEAVYLAINTQRVLNADGVTYATIPDLILVREAEMEKLWFYKEGGLAIRPDKYTAGQKTLYLHWPPKPGYADPYIKGDDQRLFTIRSASEINGGSPTAQTPYDKRYGCVVNSGPASNH